MSDDVQDFYTDLFNEIRTRADGEGRFLETAFLEHFGDWLVEAGEFDTFDVAQYRAARGMRVDAYGGDPSEAEGVLSLVVADFSTDDNVGTLTKTEVEASFRRLGNFLRASLKPGFREDLEESAKGYGLAELIHARKSTISRVRLFLVSNRMLSSRYDGLDADTVEGFPVTYNVWDLGRLQKLISSGHGREKILVDLEGDFGELLPCLPAHVNGDGYEAYLTVIPGRLLARIYDRWGARLLEQNVRSFLQARGKVNGGIRSTIVNDPAMFFAYNNGVTATAEAVETVTRNGAIFIARLANLQIVNGGQTTASISAAGRAKASLDRVFVQMKLSVVEPDNAMEVVPRISEYANSQNRVNAADFFANHPFHIRLEQFSRRVWAPASDGSFKQSKWFYERARGSYADARANLTPAKRKAFDEEYPKQQSFAKTDLAKFEMAWEGMPHIVSKGAQYNFAEYAKIIGQKWKKDSDSINELYFKTVIAKAVIFNRLEKLISEQQWYREEGGYRAQLVAYTIAKLDHALKAAGRSLNFDLIWRQQNLPPSLAAVLASIAELVRPAVTRPDSSVANVTEWAKKQACWARVQEIEFDLPEDLEPVLLDASEKKVQIKEAKSLQRLDDGIDAQARVLAFGNDHWSRVADYARQRRLLSPADHTILNTAAKRGALPTERQSVRLMEILSAVQEDGFSGVALTA